MELYRLADTDEKNVEELLSAWRAEGVDDLIEVNIKCVQICYYNVYHCD